MDTIRFLLFLGQFVIIFSLKYNVQITFSEQDRSLFPLGLKETRKSRGLELLSDVENLDIMLVENHFNAREKTKV